MNPSKPEVILKPWGKEIWFANQPGYAGKILCLNDGHRYSLQYHERKTETQYVLKGKIKLLIGPSEDALEEIILNPGEKFDVFPGTIHRAQAIEGDAELLEVSTSDLDDVVKLADDYGRSGKGNNFDLDRQLSESSGAV